MNKQKKIMVTGAAGYIGSTLCELLLNKGYKVLGVDLLIFGDHGMKNLLLNPNFEFVKTDLTNLKPLVSLFSDIYSVIHLAAIVGDPACTQQPQLAKKINWELSKDLFELSISKKNIKRFIFSSTCSNYGKMNDIDFVSEISPLHPVSLYAELKVKFEKYLLNSKTRPDFSPTALRFATVYGLSPRMRFDLTVNEFTREIATGKELVIFGEQFWRPYAHVQDLARSCITVLESNPKLVDHQVFNVGDTKENYTKKDLVKLLLKLAPKAKIKYVQKMEDPRDYRVNFDKIKNKLGYQITKRVKDGISEIFNAIRNKEFSDPYSSLYSNI